MRWLYLSPHLDDAVLSAGGLIYEQTRMGIPVEIWTFMAGFAPEDNVSPFAQLLHSMWGFASAEETTRKRREEDIQAAALLGARAVHFDFLDCIYRRGAQGEWLYSEISVPPHPEDAGLPFQIAAEIGKHLRPEDVLVCQLAVGSHVDHVIVRQGAQLVGRPLLYDIDVPYIFYKPEELEARSVGMEGSIQPVSEEGLRHWTQAALTYKSQISGLGDAFDTPEKVRASLHSYWEKHHGIRLLQLR